jgi:hypothetical protein
MVLYETYNKNFIFSFFLVAKIFISLFSGEPALYIFIIFYICSDHIISFDSSQ